MSGGLQAWITAKRPDRRALSVSRAVARNEYTYSATKPSLLPPGAYGRYLYSSTVVDDLVRGIAAALRADDGDPVAGRDEGLAFQPHPPVEGHRKVLDDDQDAAFHPYKSALRAI